MHAPNECKSEGGSSTETVAENRHVRCGRYNPIVIQILDRLNVGLRWMSSECTIQIARTVGTVDIERSGHGIAEP